MTQVFDRMARLPADRRALVEALVQRDSRQSHTIPKRKAAATAAMSFAQQRLWFVDQLDPGNPAYTCPVPVRLKGSLNLTALKASLTDLARRHEVLRTTYALQDGVPVQVVSDDPRVPLREHDVSRLDAAERERAVEHLVLLDANRAFDLEHEPVVRCELIKLAADEHVLMIDIHHIANDHWSIGVLFRDLAAFYNQRVGAPSEVLPALPTQYADYAVWQRERLAAEAGEKQLAYWQETLQGMRELDLPTDRPRPPQLSHRGGLSFLRVSAERVAQLRQLAREEGATLYMTLLAAFNVIVSRYTGESDLAIGCSVSGRDRPELRDLIGFFVNTVVLRTRFEDDPSFRELLRRVRTTTMQAYAHSEYPFDLLVRALAPQRSADRTPLVPVMFILDETPKEVAQLSGLSATFVEPSFRTTKFDLLINARPDGEGVYAHVQYSTDLFDQSTIERLIGHFETLLEDLTRRPDAPVSSLRMLSDAESQQMLVTWNATEAPYPATLCLDQQVARQARSRQAEPAVLTSGLAYSYAELERAANTVAAALSGARIARNGLVALRLERSPEFVIALLGVLKAGFAYVPLDPTHFTGQVLARNVREVGAELLLTRRALDATGADCGIPVLYIDELATGRVTFGHATPSAPSFAELFGEVTRRAAVAAQAQLRELSQVGVEELLNRKPDYKALGTGLRHALIAALTTPEERDRGAEVSDSSRSPDDLAYVICSSGSTGRAKAIALRHRGVLNNLHDLNTRFAVGSGDRCLLLSSPSFDMSVYETLGMLTAGACVVIPDADLLREPAHWLRLLRHRQVTLWNSAPALLELLVEELERAGGPELPALRLALLGGDWIPTSLPDRLRVFAKNVQVVALGGATEASIHSTIFPINEPSSGWISVPYGTPMANQRVYVLDHAQRPVPVGVPGELYLGGIGLAREYVGRAELTQERFSEIALGQLPPQRLFRTGDLARWRADGVLELLGRVDFQVKVRGLRVDLAEVESVLRAQTGIKEAAVVAQESGGSHGLAAFYALHDGVEIASDVLRDVLAEVLPAYMVPSRFTRLDALPKNRNGKTDRRALSSQRADSADHTLPRNPRERELLALWERVLGRGGFGIDADFFELGGDSLAAIRVARGVAGGVPVLEVWKRRTVRALAAYLRENAAQPSELLTLLTPEGRKPGVNLVCIPYGGGNVTAYQPLAEALPAQFVLWSVALPGHDPGRPDEALESSDQVARRLCEEIQTRVHGPLIVFGQCAGASMAVDVASRLEASGRTVLAVYAGAALPDSSPAQSVERGQGASQQELHAYLKDLGGFAGALPEDEARSVIAAVRHDLLEHARFFARPVARRLTAPLRCVVGDDDVVTADHAQRHHDWLRYANTVELAVIARGNHYFVKHEAQQLARVIAQAQAPEQAPEPRNVFLQVASS